MGEAGVLVMEEKEGEETCGGGWARARARAEGEEGQDDDEAGGPGGGGRGGSCSQWNRQPLTASPACSTRFLRYHHTSQAHPIIVITTAPARGHPCTYIHV